MPTEPKLEQYLSVLDKSLGQIPISDRSDIITEIKSHVLEAKERAPDQDMSQILASIGEPENVANRYLIERGIKPGKPSKTPVVKWLTIGFLGTLAIATLGVLTLIWKFTPLVRVDENSGQVLILGGLIEVNENSEMFRHGSSFSKKGDSNSFVGEFPLDRSKFKMIHILFSNGKIEFNPSDDHQMRWSCKIHGKEGSAVMLNENHVFTLNMNKTKGAKCEIQLPSGFVAKIEGANGKLEVNHPQSEFDIKLDNGKIEITPDPKNLYRYETQVLNGRSDEFTSSSSPKAILIKAKVTNGSIGN